MSFDCKWTSQNYFSLGQNANWSIVIFFWFDFFFLSPGIASLNFIVPGELSYCSDLLNSENKLSVKNSQMTLTGLVGISKLWDALWKLCLNISFLTSDYEMFSNLKLTNPVSLMTMILEWLLYFPTVLWIGSSVRIVLIVLSGYRLISSLETILVKKYLKTLAIWSSRSSTDYILATFLRK